MADPGSEYSSGAFSGIGGGGLSETEIDRDIGRQMALGPTREFDAPAWYGEDETYGTQGDWLTGEGLTTAWGDTTSAYPSYANPVVERIATNPAMNMFVNAEGMLRRGGGPGPWDYAALGLSVVPVVGQAAVRMASPYVKSFLKTTADSPRWKINLAHRIGMAKFHRMQRKNQEAFDRSMSDSAADFKEWQAAFRLDLELSAKNMEVARQKMWKDIGDSLGRTPAEMEALKADALIRMSNAKPRLASPLDLITQQKTMATDVRNMPIDEFLAMDVRMQDRLLANANLSRRDIQLVHFVNSERLANEKLVVQLENVGTPEFTEMAKTLRANIKEVDEVIKNLSVAEQKRIGIYDKYGLDALKVWRENQTKVALKPGHIGMSDMEWATLVKGKTLSEVKDIARKLTLRVVD